MQQQARGVPNVSSDHVFMGNGVSELIDLTLRGLLNPGDEVLIPTPDYPLWTAATVLNGGKAVHYPCPESQGFNPDVAAIEALITPAHARARRDQPEQSDRRGLQPRGADRARADRRAPQPRADVRRDLRPDRLRRRGVHPARDALQGHARARRSAACRRCIAPAATASAGSPSAARWTVPSAT